MMNGAQPSGANETEETSAVISYPLKPECEWLTKIVASPHEEAPAGNLIGDGTERRTGEKSL